MTPASALGLGAFVLLVAAVEGLVAMGAVSPLVVPAPTDVAAAVVEMAADGELIVAFGETLAVTFAATAAAALLGIPCGYALHRYANFGRAYESWLAALFASPMILLYPLFLVLFGRDYLTIGIMGFVTGIIPVILNTRLAFDGVPRCLNRVARSFNCSPSQQFWKVQLPAAAPVLFTGLRLGLIYALVNIIGIEFLIDFGGLGRLVSEMYDRFDIPGMYAAILFIVLVSAMFLLALSLTQRRLRPA